ncbi:MAG: M14 family murein peptide amidase A [Smithella sp.]|jgi:protein MpaA|nr:M14 family murein peptide amidase A [Smithella sp.]
MDWKILDREEIKTRKLKELIKIIYFCLLIFFLLPLPVSATDTSFPKELTNYIEALEKQCAKYGWSDIKPREIPWEYYRTTQKKYPLIFVHFGDSGKNCVLFLGAVHGDETPTVYLMLKMAHYIKDNPQIFKDKCIVIAPLVNPDGFLSKNPRRVNANGVDINRNFPTKDWSAEALKQWKIKQHKNRRYYPGQKPASEQETMFQIALIKRFNPQKILSVHSPLNFFDYDGPSSDLDSFEHWLEKISKESNHPLRKFGFFPGSLGNYAGHERNIFTLTLELPSSKAGKAKEYFDKFQTSILKFINLSVLVE